MRGFSPASVVLSYFLVGGGLFTSMLVLGLLHDHRRVVAYGVFAGGAFVGGFVAARASRGSTVLEAAIGAVAVVASIVALAAGTAAGKLVWGLAHDAVVDLIVRIGLTGMVGALAGAYLSEQMFGEATRSSLPWVVYTALSTFGASVLAMAGAAILFFGHGGHADHVQKLSEMMLIGIGGGCLLAGLAVGASARTRPLFASLVGGGAGVAGFSSLLARAGTRTDHDTLMGIAVLAAAGAIVTLVGAALGWAVFGRADA